MIDEAVADYADETYNPDYAAYYFFKEHNDSEADERMKNLNRLRVHVENVLRDNVANNYRIFMQATREIQRMNADIAELKQAVQDTSAVVSNLSTMKLSTQMQFSSIQRPGSAADDPLMRMRDSMLSKLPAWLKASPKELDKLILEQQYTKAVKLIGKCRSYIASVEGAVDLGPAAEAIVKRMDMHAASLCHKLQRSLANIPSSQIWGHVEQQRRLRLLISLGSADVAAEAFAKIQMHTIRRSMRFLEASGDPLSSAQLHCQVFFQVLEVACRAYIDLFDERKHATNHRASYVRRTPSAVNAQLLVWVTKELRSFVDMISRQLRLGSAEASLQLLDMCRSPNDRPASKGRAGEAPAAPNPANLLPAAQAPELQQQNLAVALDADATNKAPEQRRSLNKLVMKLKNSDSFATRNNVANPAADTAALPGINASLSRSSSSQASVSGQATAQGTISSTRKQKLGNVGPFQFVAHACTAAFFHCQKIDVLGLNISTLYGWTLLPHLCRLLDQHTEKVLQELANQIKHDAWVPLEASLFILRPPPNCVADMQAQPSVSTMPDALNSSFDWLVTVINATIDDCWLFLYPELIFGRAQEHVSRSQESHALCVAHYSRDDFAALEPRVAECVTTLLNNYLEEVERVDVQAFNSQQRECLKNCLATFEQMLLPSVEEVIRDHFFTGDFAFDQTISKLRKEALQLAKSRAQQS